MLHFSTQHRSAWGRRCSGDRTAKGMHRPAASLSRRQARSAGATALLPPARASQDGEQQQPWDALPSDGPASTRGGHWQHGHPDDSWDFVDEEQVPAPANLPVHEDELVVRSSSAADHPALGEHHDGLVVFPPPGLDSFNGLDGFDGPLHQHFWAHQLGAGSSLRSARWMVTDRPGLDMRTLGADVVNNMGPVYVILFGVGAHDTEGIYSLRAFGEDGLPQETIIVFESEEDANRYAGLLEATMDHTPSVCSIPPPELLEFCGDAGYQCRLEPEGSLLIPPDFNVGVTDWERATRLRQGMFAVLESEPDRHTRPPPAGPQRAGAAPAPGQAYTAPPANPHNNNPLSSVSATRPGGPSSSSMAKYHPSFSDDELADIRSMLESLLPLTGTPASSPAATTGSDGAALPSASSVPSPPTSSDDFQ